MPTNVLIAFYSTYGHIHRMALAVAESAESVPDSTVRPRRAKPTGEANDFIRELLEFTRDYCDRANEWRAKGKPRLSAEDRTTLMERIHQCANELSVLAQSFLPARKRAQKHHDLAEPA